MTLVRRSSRPRDDGAEAAFYAAASAHLTVQLRPLVNLMGLPEPGAVAELLTTANGVVLHDLIHASLSGVGGQLTEAEALTAIVRLLALGTGDPNGDAVTPDPLDPCAGDLERTGLGFQSDIPQILRSLALVHAIIDLLARYGPEFDRGESMYLRLEALKALRLVMTPEGLLYVGAAHAEQSWWPEEDPGTNLRNGDTRRKLVDVLLQQLENVGDTMGQKPKIVILGSLWSLAAANSHIRTRILQSGGEAVVASLLRAQIRTPQLVVEPALVAECGVLATLAAGSRVHERKMAKLGVDVDVVEMLRKFLHHRQAVCAGLVLLALLANDESVAARLADPEALAAISAARARWPEEAEKAFKRNVHYVSPTATALMKGTSLASARRQRETSRRALPNSARSRPAVRAAAMCVVGGAG